MLLWSPFFLVLLFCLFTLFLLYPRMYLLPVCIQPNSTYEDCVAVAVHMSTYEGSRCRTYDLQHSPSLLLLLLMVDQLVYHAVLLLYYILRSIYHPAHAFYTVKNCKTSAVSTTDRMVETQLCKLRGTSATLVGRAYSIFHLYGAHAKFFAFFVSSDFCTNIMLSMYED